MIRIQDPDPDPLIRGMDPNPHQNVMDRQHWYVPKMYTCAVPSPAQCQRLYNIIQYVFTWLQIVISLRWYL